MDKQKAAPEKDPAAVSLGRKGGLAKVPKGFSVLTKKQRSLNAKLAAAARWGKRAIVLCVLVLCGRLADAQESPVDAFVRGMQIRQSMELRKQQLKLQQQQIALQKMEIERVRAEQSKKAAQERYQPRGLQLLDAGREKMRERYEDFEQYYPQFDKLSSLFTPGPLVSESTVVDYLEGLYLIAKYSTFTEKPVESTKLIPDTPKP